MAAAPAPVVRSARALWRTAGFGTIVLGPAAPEPVTLAGTGTAVWETLAEPRTRAELVAVLAARFGTPPQVVADDLDPVLSELLSIGAVCEAGDARHEPPATESP